jgi:hypothetical protein
VASYWLVLHDAGVDAPGEWPLYWLAREHLDDLLDLVAARAARAS